MCLCYDNIAIHRDNIATKHIHIQFDSIPRINPFNELA